MKLFKSLLVAPAALGLLAPISVTANELNLNDVSGYSSSKEVKNINEFTSADLAVTNSRIDGLEARINNFEAGAFSETTTAAFTADMVIGAVEGDSDGEAVTAFYGFQIDLNSSFTGEDSLDITLEAGSATSSVNGYLDPISSTDALTVDGISYTFPVGDNATVFVGDSVPGSSLYNTACVYSGQTVNLDDCGNSGAAMDSPITGKTSLGASYDFGNGWTAALGYEGQGASTDGLLTKEGRDIWGGQLTYTGDNYGVSVTLSDFEHASSDYTYTALNAYFTPESGNSLPSISAGYEVGNTSTSGSVDSSQWMIGLQWDEAGPGTFGIAFGTDEHMNDNATAYHAYEAYYSYPINDGMTVTPLFFVRETSGDDETGVFVKTSFNF